MHSLRPELVFLECLLDQRELKLDGAIGQEEICNYLNKWNFF